MTTNRPSCPLCGNNTKKNGTTSKSTTRWRCEVSRVLFLGLCLDFHYFSTGVVFPKFGFDFSRRAVAQALVEP